MADFYCIPTSLGLIKLASAANGGTPVQIVEFAVGDANGEPYLPQTRVNAIALIHEQYRALLESVTVSPSDASVYIAKIKIPANVGGFYLCEIALIDTDGDIIYLANYPYNYKPTLTQGAGGELVIPVYLQSSAADTITIIQNPNVITLSQAEGDARYALGTQLSNEALIRENNDLALAIALAAEITNREIALNLSQTTNQLSLNHGNTILKMGFAIYGELPATGVIAVASFTTPFPNVCLFAMAVPYNPNPTGQNNFLVTTKGWDSTKITFIMQELAGSGHQYDAGFIWLAIGF